MGNKLAKNPQEILPPAYIYDFGAPLWRIKSDSASGSLALEVRDGDVLLTSFYTLDCNNFLLQQLPLPQQQLWWQGLEDFYDGLVYLHGYGDRKLGQHKGISALTAAGISQWEKPELAFYGISADGLYAFEVANPEIGLLLLHSYTGKLLKTGISPQQAADAVAAFNLVRNADNLYPVLYEEGAPYFATVKTFLSDALGVSAVQAIEYAETGSCFVVSYYEKINKDLLQNNVAVFNLEGDFYFSETLADGLTGIGSDTFFIFRDNLFFIRNRTVLQVQTLPAP